MVDFWQTTVLAALQGITEFLPVSSSGHLVLLSSLMQLQSLPLVFNVTLHAATMMAILLFFRRQIARLIVAMISLIPGKQRLAAPRQRQLLVAIIVANLPTALIGLSLDRLEGYFNLTLAGGGFLLSALMLLLSAKFTHQVAEPFKIWHPLLIGTVQGLAVLPGISRSGVTIATAIILGWRHRQAAEFSLLISLPATLGALLLKLKDFDRLLTVAKPELLLYAFALTFVIGLGAIKILLQLMNGLKYRYFGFYLIFLAGALLIPAFVRHLN